MQKILNLGFALIALSFSILPLSAQASSPQQFLTYAGVVPVYKDGFSHLNYVNIDAPKGGSIHLSMLGAFDSFNPFPLKGSSFPNHNTYLMHLIFESLMFEPLDDKLTSYCFLAEWVDQPEDNASVTFKLREDIRFSDGSKANADDLVFTFNILREKGKPFYRSYYGDVDKVEKLDDFRVKFHFKNPKNKELAMILGQLPLLSKEFWSKHNFEETLLKPILSTGPYMIDSFEAGRKVVLKRNPNYWGIHHPLSKGRWNYDKIKYDYFKDSTVVLQAFIGGDIDFRMETTPSNWMNEYNGPTFKSGYHIKEVLPSETPSGRLGLYFNLRRKIFQDPLVREALTYLYDFEWLNKNLFSNLYTRTTSYFQNTELASSGLPEGAELDLLNPFKKDLPPRVFTEVYAPPKNDGSGNIRAARHKALELLKKAGWIIVEDKLIHAKTKEPFEFEFLLPDSSLEKIIQPFVNNLAKVGIKTRLRIVDSAQYEVRVNNFDYDILYTYMGITFSPGNEQEGFWGSKFADVKGSPNKTGLKDKVVDDIIQKIINIKDRPELIVTSKVFDRVLQWMFVSIPLYHNPNYWIVYKDRFARPKISPKVSLPFLDAWWVDPVKDKALDLKKP